MDCLPPLCSLWLDCTATELSSPQCGTDLSYGLHCVHQRQQWHKYSLILVHTALPLSCSHTVIHTVLLPLHKAHSYEPLDCFKLALNDITSLKALLVHEFIIAKSLTSYASLRPGNSQMISHSLTQLLYLENIRVTAVTVPHHSSVECLVVKRTGPKPIIAVTISRPPKASAVFLSGCSWP